MSRRRQFLNARFCNTGFRRLFVRASAYRLNFKRTRGASHAIRRMDFCSGSARLETAVTLNVLDEALCCFSQTLHTTAGILLCAFRDYFLPRPFKRLFFINSFIIGRLWSLGCWQHRLIANTGSSVQIFRAGASFVLAYWEMLEMKAESLVFDLDIVLL